MTGLAERLDNLAREATSKVELVPPQLAVRARRRHRMRTVVGAIFVAGCAAAGSLYAATSSSGPPKVVRTATPSGTTPVTTSTPSGPGVWADLAEIAGKAAAQYGDVTPLTAEAVATNLGRFDTAVNGGSAAFRAIFTGVYFIQMTGQFTCGPSCYNLSGHAPNGTVLSLAVDQTTLEITGTALTNQPVDLSRLGRVHPLDLTVASTETGPATSTSIAVVTVPSVVGMTEASAAAVLGTLGLKVDYTMQSSSIAPQGTVFAETPAAGSQVVIGSTISLTVSSGPAAGPVG